MSNNLHEATTILAETPMCFIATVNGTKPQVRAFQYQFEQAGALWFCTAKSKDVFKQLQANPAVEICAVTQNMAWVRIAGTVVFKDEPTVKERILAEQPLIKSIYKSASNPDFTTFCLEHGTFTIADFSGTPPRTGSF
ncbi:pyridoxamine 5'-phosphate oxidase family protein [Desulfovibrio sp. OttesenSCG-928-F07]|nr:pyridoxamine 5'-phosphate oxidase family protein [Desulfovibrio sp. OttesenSCG-928-F07]